MIRSIHRTCNLVSLTQKAGQSLWTKTGKTSKVPASPTWTPVDPKNLPEETEIESELVDHLERLALVDFSNQESVDRLSAAIRFADRLQLVDTTGVEPMDTVLEHRSLFLRKDEVTDGNCKEEVTMNARKTIEDYYVAPPGNIPLAKKEKSYGGKKSSKTS